MSYIEQPKPMEQIMIKPADENSPFAGVKFDGTLNNEGGTIGFQRVVNERGEDVTGYSRGYREGYDAARKQLRDEIAMKAMQGMLANPNYDNASYQEMATEAYEVADAMLKAGRGKAIGFTS